MIFSSKFPVLALLCLTSTTAWSEPVYFCKAKKIYDEDIHVPTKIVYEDCSGVAFFWYAKNLVKASCWNGATDLFEGKCETHKDDSQDATIESSETADQEAETLD